MTRIEVREFRESDLPAAAGLLAARHRLNRETHPFLAPALEDPLAWQETLRQTLETAKGVAAIEHERLAGYMLGRNDLPDQRSMGARYGDPRAGIVPVEGHAAALDCDARLVYTALYAEVGAAWVRDGFFSHGVQVMLADTAAHEALVHLGFGHKFATAVRSLDLPLPQAPAASFEVREASPADAAEIFRLENELDYWHSRPPMFMPVDPETEGGAHRFQETLFDNPAAAIFLAYRRGRPLGMVSMMPPAFLPAPLRTEGMVYLYQGIVSQEERGGGAGEALLARALAWARDRGYTHVALHYHTANPSGGPFWRKHGFEAVQQNMVRLVDSRIAWARDWR
jgi:GNAT superfamily N-acetyltransferase